MWKVFLSSRLLQGALIGLVLFCVGCLLYLQHVERENARDVARTAERIRQYEERNAMPEPPTAPKRGATVLESDLHAALPPSAVPDDIPDRYKLPDAWKDLYFIRKDGRTNPDIPLSDIQAFIEEVMVYVVENYNPRRPIAEVWPAFMEASLIYNRLTEQELGVFPGDIGADHVGRAYEQVWAFPEVFEIILENIKRGDTVNSQMYLVYQIEMGLDMPNWNLVIFEDGREFRMRRNTRYQFGNLEIGLAHPERSPLIVVNEDTFTVSDAELERISGWNYNINPFTRKPITRYREPSHGLAEVDKMGGGGIQLEILPPLEKMEEEGRH